MHHPTMGTIQAESTAEMLDHLIPGYIQADNFDKVQLRCDYAADLAPRLTGLLHLTVSATDEVLVDIFHEPYTAAPRPKNHKYWLNPGSGEIEFLTSLHQLGVVTIKVSRNRVG